MSGRGQYSSKKKRDKEDCVSYIVREGRKGEPCTVENPIAGANVKMSLAQGLKRIRGKEDTGSLLRKSTHQKKVWQEIRSEE